jgi:ribosome biogenesis GTPase A
MNKKIVKAIKFRKSFDFNKLSKEIYQWFPGHMHKGLKQMYEQLPHIDAVIEVHDARVNIT